MTKIFQPSVLLRLEGAAVALVCVFAYARLDAGWLMFVVLLLAPDLGMLGYLGGPRVGAVSYDLLHFEAWPIALGAIGFATSNTLLVAVALIWLTHIGGDRALSYGLKYPTAFKDTHLQRV